MLPMMARGGDEDDVGAGVEEGADVEDEEDVVVALALVRNGGDDDGVADGEADLDETSFGLRQPSTE